VSLRNLDFSRSKPVSRVGMCLLAAGALAYALAFAHRQQVAEEQAAAERVLRDAELARDVPALSPQASVAEARMRAARMELDRPWLQALGVVEAATVDPVFLLSMNFERGSGLLRLEGEAPNFGGVLSYVSKLEQAPLSSAVLLSHELVTDPNNGRGVVHFSAATQWSVR
jgi:hypothetical protein